VTTGVRHPCCQHPHHASTNLFLDLNCSGDAVAVKLYKSQLHQMQQQHTATGDALLDLEDQKQKMVTDLAEKELEYSEYRQMSKKRLAVTTKSAPTSGRKQRRESVPTSVRKQRRGEGGISATMSTTSAMSDNLSYDGTNDE
jgi:hypothetical protein